MTLMEILIPIRVEQGSIAINGKGLNAKESNSLQILTEAAQVNAGVWANAVETRTGKKYNRCQVFRI